MNLPENISKLILEIRELKNTRKASENALEAAAEADQEASAKVVETQKALRDRYSPEAYEAWKQACEAYEKADAAYNAASKIEIQINLKLGDLKRQALRDIEAFVTGE